jgi:hypothetical protein
MILQDIYYYAKVREVKDLDVFCGPLLDNKEK